jgi:hypothetical protein
MTEPRDHELSRNRDAGASPPSQKIGDAILAASRARAAASPWSRIGFRWIWAKAVALTATAFAIFMLALIVFEQWTEEETRVISVEAGSAAMHPGLPALQQAPAAPAVAAPEPESEARRDAGLAQPAAGSRNAEPAQAPVLAPSATPDAARPRLGPPGGVAARLASPAAIKRTPERWLDEIRLLKLDGNTADAQRELEEFKDRYPDYRVPDDLR